MNSIIKLANYRKALERWARQMRVRQIDEQAGHHHKKPMEPEPPMQQFEIMPDDAWALKIRVEVLKPILVPLTLDEKLPVKKSLPPKRKPV